MSSETREIMHDQHTHPVGETKTYWVIGVFLFVITAAEIGAYYLEDSLGAAMVPVIAVLSALKFYLVVAFYMHLKYDSKIFSGIFFFPMALGVLVIGGLYLLYHVVHPLR